MPLFSHPTYVRAQERVAERFRSRALTLKRLRPVLFLCGGLESPRRAELAQYLHRHAGDLFVFFAEDVWEHVKALQGANALAMETQLARLADILVVIVESPGTFAELGAFAALGELRAKLLPILDRSYQDHQSFINTGPITWINEDSRFKPSIYCDFATLLLVADEVIARARLIPDRGALPQGERVDTAKKPKHLLFLLSDIVAVTGPTTETECKRLLTSVLGAPPTWDVHSLLGLLSALGLIKAINVHGVRYYFRPLEDGELKAFQSQRFFDLAELRADFVSSLQSIPEGRGVLQALSDNVTATGPYAS